MARVRPAGRRCGRRGWAAELPRRAAARQAGRPRSRLTRTTRRSPERKGAAANKQEVWTPAERRARSRLSKRLGLRPTGRWKGKEWTEKQLALLGTDHDEAVAKKLGRTRGAVASQRVLRGIPAFSEWAGGGRGWTEEEVAHLGTMPDAELAARLDRTPGAVTQKRESLGIAAHSGWRSGGRAWTEAEDELVRTLPPAEAAARTGRSLAAVYSRRSHLKVARRA